MTIAKDQLRSIVKRVQNLEESKHDLQNDIKEIFMEAKANGFDVKTIKKVIKEINKDAADREEEEQLFQMYLDAVEGFDTTPLARAVNQ